MTNSAFGFIAAAVGRTRDSAPVLPPPWEVHDKQGRRIANKAKIRETHIPGWTHPGKRFTRQPLPRERPFWQPWTRGGSLQCRSRPSQRLANEPPRSPGRNTQLRGSCDRQGVPCTRLANLILAPKQERQRIAAYIPRWGIQLAAHLSESTAWAIYRDRLKRFGSLIGDREPIVLHKEIPGMGRAKRYIITIADDDRAPLDKLCQKLIAADATCDVLRNPIRQDRY
jgi:hypothetical protein